MFVKKKVLDNLCENPVYVHKYYDKISFIMSTKTVYKQGIRNAIYQQNLQVSMWKYCQ